MVRDRGQLLLIGAVLIGLTVIGTVVMLNGMQHADSVSGRSESQTLDDAERAEEMVERDVGRMTDLILAKNPGPGTAADYVERDVGVYHNQTRNLTLDSGAGTVNVTFNDTVTRGERIQQSTTQQFAPGGSRDLATDVDYLRGFEMTVDTFSTSAPGPSNSVVVVAENASGNEWRAAVYVDGSSQAKVRVTTPSGTVAPCDAGTEPITLYLVEGGNESGGCSFTGIREAIGTPESIRLEQSNDAEGTYRVLVDGTPRVSGFPQVSSDDYPVRPGVTIRYRSPELSYNRTILVEDPEAPR